MAQRQGRVISDGDNAITDSGSVRAVATTTTLTITLDVLPVDTKKYTFTYALIA